MERKLKAHEKSTSKKISSALCFKKICNSYWSTFDSTGEIRTFRDKSSAVEYAERQGLKANFEDDENIDTNSIDYKFMGMTGYEKD